MSSNSTGGLVTHMTFLLSLILVWLVIVTFKLSRINSKKVELDDVIAIVNARLQRYDRTSRKPDALADTSEPPVVEQPSVLPVSNDLGAFVPNENFATEKPETPAPNPAITLSKTNEPTRKMGHLPKVFIEN